MASPANVAVMPPAVAPPAPDPAIEITYLVNARETLRGALSDLENQERTARSNWRNTRLADLSSPKGAVYADITSTYATLKTTLKQIADQMEAVKALSESVHGRLAQLEEDDPEDVLPVLKKKRDQFAQIVGSAEGQKNQAEARVRRLDAEITKLEDRLNPPAAAGRKAAKARRKGTPKGKAKARGKRKH